MKKLRLKHRPRKWTKFEERMLLQGVGVNGIKWFQKRINKDGRSVDSIRSKARRLFEAGLAKGSYSLLRACRDTGYHSSQFFRAREALGQKWKRTSKKGTYLIYEEQFLELIDFLRHDYWSKYHRLYNCLWCGTSNMDHKGQGLCVRCYNKYVRQLNLKKLPVGSKKLKQFLVERGLTNEKIEQQLDRGRALTIEMTIKLFKGEPND